MDPGWALVKRSSKSTLSAFNVQQAAVRHRIAGIEHQVHDDLLELHGIGHGMSGARMEHGHDLDLFSDEPLQDTYIS